MIRSIKFFFSNWKMIIHLWFRTYRFGVNNSWWSDWDSMFGLPFRKRFHLIQSYKLMRLRAEIGFIPQHDFVDMFPIYCWKKGIKKVNYES